MRNLEINESVFMSCNNGSMLIGTIVSISEKAIKIDYCFDSCFNKGVTVYTYTTWIPKSMLIDNGVYGVDIKPNFKFNKDYVKSIKKYYLGENLEKKFI